jgi:hypothetical protein
MDIPHLLSGGLHIDLAPPRTPSFHFEMVGFHGKTMGKPWENHRFFMGTRMNAAVFFTVFEDFSFFCAMSTLRDTSRHGDGAKLRYLNINTWDPSH